MFNSLIQLDLSFVQGFIYGCIWISIHVVTELVKDAPCFQFVLVVSSLKMRCYRYVDLSESSILFC